MPTHRLLLIQEPTCQRASLTSDLRTAGFEVIEAISGSSGLDALTVRPDVIVLNLDLPDLDGQHVLTRLRTLTAVPILVISGRTGRSQHLRALDAGANDVLIEPVELSELIARVQAKVRRHDSATVRVGQLEVSVARRMAWFRGKEVALSRTEFNVLMLLMEHAGQVVPREAVRELIRPGAECSFNLVNVHMGNLRLKLRAVGGHGVLRTVHGVGYLVGDVR